MTGASPRARLLPRWTGAQFPDDWIPACAGMTAFAGMTACAGMTGLRRDDAASR